MNELKLIIQDAFEKDRIYWKDHFLQRMRERGVKFNQIVEFFKKYDIIKEYISDKPFPSYLLLGYIKQNPLHIVLSVNIEEKEIHLITIYTPDSKLWDENYRRKK